MNPEIQKVREELYCSMFEKQVEDQTIVNYAQKVVESDSKLSVRTVTPYTKTQINFLNGNQFFGDIDECRMSGSGRYLWADDGSIYEGDFGRPNVIEGHGTFKFRGSSKYCGNFVDGKFHGKGQLAIYFFNYVGSFDSGEFNGQGCLKSGIEAFDGCFSSGKKIHGKRIYTNGTFVGDFHSDETRNCGKYEFGNGDVFCGSFVNGMFEGFGVYTWNDIALEYIGSWRRNSRDGLGMLKVGDVTCVTIFRNNVKHGPGIVWAKNGRVFASMEMFRQDELVGCIEIDVRQENSDIVRKLLDPKEHSTVEKFFELISEIAGEGKREDPTIHPFHVPWFDLKVEHSAVWKFVSRFDDVNAEQEFTSMKQTIKASFDVLQDLHHRYADFSSKAGGESRTRMLRIGLWQLMRDLELHKKGPKFNIQTTLEEAESEFNILCVDPNDPFEAVSIASLVQYLMYVTLHLNKNHDFVLSCAINQRSKIFGLFATMFVIFLREFLCPMMSTRTFTGSIPKLIQDDRTFVTNFANIVGLGRQKLSIRDVFKTADSWTTSLTSN